ncbi:MAG: hypothetical protein Q8Q47_05360, partial [Ignavibacteriaceae bacterium]|nr:hypothetical protein [Ignavibacteriaceae bacterium]
NNSISFKDAHFKTKFGDYDFYIDKAINFITGDLILDMVSELAEIFYVMCSAINYERIIIDPYSEQVENDGH